MADEEIGTIFDNRSADIIAQVARTVMGQVKNYISARQADNSGGGVVWHNAAGSTSEDIPGMSIVALTTEFTWCDGFPLYKVVKPSTTWTDRYAIVHETGIKRNESGWITFEGPCKQAADSSVTKDDKLGPKAGQYTQTKGYPATSRVDGVVSASSNIYFGPVHPITSLIGRSSTATSIAVGATTNWRIFGGTPGSEVDIGVETPSAYSPAAIAKDKRLLITSVGSGLEIVTGGSGAGLKLFKGSLSGTLGSTSGTVGLGSVTAYDGTTAATTLTANNPLHLAAANGSIGIVVKNEGDNTHDLLNVLHVQKTVVSSVAYSTAGVLSQNTRTLVTMDDGIDAASTILTAVTKTVVVDVLMYGFNLSKVTEDVQVFSAANPSTDVIILGTECPST